MADECKDCKKWKDLLDKLGTPRRYRAGYSLGVGQNKVAVG
jgi:hypothetical protein